MSNDSLPSDDELEEQAAAAVGRAAVIERKARLYYGLLMASNALWGIALEGHEDDAEELEMAKSLALMSHDSILGHSEAFVAALEVIADLRLTAEQDKAVSATASRMADTMVAYEEFVS